MTCPNRDRFRPKLKILSGFFACLKGGIFSDQIEALKALSGGAFTAYQKNVSELRFLTLRTFCPNLIRFLSEIASFQQATRDRDKIPSKMQPWI